MLKRRIQIAFFIVCVLFLSLNLSTSYLLNFSTSVAHATPPINKDHTTHDPAKCHNLQFNLLLPADDLVDNMQVLRGIVPIKIEMSPEYQGYGRDDHYGVFISVDYKGVFEEDGIEFGEGNILDFPDQIDTTTLNNGTHIINVNVNDYYNHTGSVLIKVIVDN